GVRGAGPGAPATTPPGGSPASPAPGLSGTVGRQMGDHVAAHAAEQRSRHGRLLYFLAARLSMAQREIERSIKTSHKQDADCGGEHDFQQRETTTRGPNVHNDHPPFPVAGLVVA